MITENPTLMSEIRARFAHVESCPEAGPRIFFENAGGALTLKSVVATSNHFAAIPDNQGRDNEMAHKLVRVIDQAKSDMREFLNAPNGDIFAGESGTELLFRLVMNAVLETQNGGVVLGSTLEHPATRSACTRWAKVAGKPYIQVPHNDSTGCVTADDYIPHLRPDIRVATILHTSPVTGMGVDVAAVAKAIRAVAPDAIIIVDGIQHASHGLIDIKGYDIDGYVISPYKVFSRHGYGIAWTSPRLNALPHDSLIGGPEGNWELGTRDTGAYATMSDVVDYFDWLGRQVSDAQDRRARIEAAGAAIHEHEQALTNAMISGTGNLAGLADLPGVGILGGADNPTREGLVSITLDGMDAPDLVSALRALGIRTHTRKADHYSGNILNPLGLPAAVRVSMCHYNTLDEVSAFLTAMREIVDRQGV
ncbi:aminotransferase class V-fold PLP-dependent enzyme [Sulfitobacter aestuariivivens]|uniref:Aminotransferase class V-fold PLP-dependent enzyme n=1 Tax=Sulfitobacter aestuariivivens TaxID=2766981 RepID=A0A927HH96_9RHOB|nr:aminotransferase class V-fold PLP-dependent enzyme [Sulfitobacter aestuariivivens]MBD3666249.1 aminotransferase class V-fold PLP-dependent enzyme [Sulfitobacter aestuariivivens]